MSELRESMFGGIVPKDIRCTWVNCPELAEVFQSMRDGKTWAHLCRTHDQMMQSAVEKAEPGLILSYWIKAQGGPHSAVIRILDMW